MIFVHTNFIGILIKIESDVGQEENINVNKCIYVCIYAIK